MNPTELRIERRHIYETRLGMLEIHGPPPAWANNMAVEEADAHIDALLNPVRPKRTESQSMTRDAAAAEKALADLRALRDSL